MLDVNEGMGVARTRLKAVRIFFVLVLLVLLNQPGKTNGQTLTVLHTFNGYDGFITSGWLIQASDGYFYGMTNLGGPGYNPNCDCPGNGTAFKINSAGSFTSLHGFTGGADGKNPTAGLVQGRDGYFYGTTPAGTTYGYGCVFKITAQGTLTTLHSFTGGSDGGSPTGGLMQTSDGYFYGTTASGGTNNAGTVFKINSAGSLTTIYHFGKLVNNANDNGGGPGGGLILGLDGYFYGTTAVGGTNGAGTIFKMSSAGSLTTLYQFSHPDGTGANTDGAYPWGNLVQDSAGFLYGATPEGGQSVFGTLFKIGPNGQFTAFHNFSGPSDGTFPSPGLIIGSDGNIYGTAQYDGSGQGGYGGGPGTVFQITPTGTLTTVAHFGGTPGINPAIGVVQGSDGNFYGATSLGSGSLIGGTIYKLTIPLNPSLPPAQISSLTQQGNDMLLQWTTPPGTNLVQATNGASDGSYSNNFLTISPLIITPGSSTVATNYLDAGGATNFPCRYYRVAMVQQGQISVSPAELDFGPVVLGTNSQSIFVVTNNAAVPLATGQATIVGGPFTIVSGSSFSLPPWGAANVVVQFTPPTGGSYTSQVIFSTDIAGSSTNIITGFTATPPVALFSASPTNGTVPLTVTFADDSTGTITNWSWNFGDGTTTNLNTAGISHTYTNTGVFTVSETTSGPLGTSSTNENNLISVVLPPQLTVTPPSLNFGTQPAGQTSTQAFVVINSGSLTLNGTAAAPTPFQINSGSPYSVGAGQTAAVTVAFAPVTAGVYNASAVFTSNGGSATNALTGTAIAPPAALFSAAPTSGTEPLTVSFTDNSTGTITNWSWNFGDGTTTNLITTGVSHTYVSTGEFTVSETVSGPLGTNSTNENNLINVLPQPSRLTVTPASLNFGTLIAGQSSTQVFDVINSGSLTLNGTAGPSGPFQINSGSPYSVGGGQTASVVVVFAPATAGVYYADIDFNSSGGLSANAVAGTALTPLVALFSAAPTNGIAPLTVIFTDTSTGTITNRFWAFGDGITTNLNTAGVSHTYTSTGLFTVSEAVSGPLGTSSTYETNLLSVLPQPAQLTVTPSTLNFGTLVAGQTSTQTFAVINSGSLTLNGTAAAPTPFQINSGSPYSVGAGQTTAVAVAFAPVTAGVYNASVVFTSNGGSSTDTVAGTALAPPVALFSAAPTNGTAPLTVIFTDASTGDISNRVWAFGDGTSTNLTAAGVSHVYATSGIYSVSLIVTGPLDANTNTQSNLITVTHVLLASDNAADPAYSGGWTNGSNGGSGFDPWTLTASGVIGSSSNGYFIGTSVSNAFVTPPGIDTSAKSWGLYANSANFTAAYRSFSNSLSVGGTVKLDMRNGFINSDNSDGFALRNGNVTTSFADYKTNARFELYYTGMSQSNSYAVSDAAGFHSIGVPFTGTGLHLVFTLNTTNTYTLLVIDNASGNTNTTVNGALEGPSGSTIDSIALYNRNAGSGPLYDAFFNSLQILGP